VSRETGGSASDGRRRSGQAASGRTWQGAFTLTEVRELDVGALRACDGFAYRYQRGGRISWIALSSGEELEVKVPASLPQHDWRHLEDCGCSACRPSPAALVGAPRAARRSPEAAPEPPT
jgi:hypothetical protein